MSGLHECSGCGWRFETGDDLKQHEEYTCDAEDED